ncbi:MAG TPA: hypothetical protein PKA37_13495 [Planctomycetota bacterium]|nr:hypothetical protein [Planctomycetota bacterium]
MVDVQLTMPPRDVRFRLGVRLGRGILWALALVPIVPLQLVSEHQAKTLRNLYENGIHVPATVTARRSVSGKSRSYYLSYRYHVDGKAYSDEKSVSRSRFEASQREPKFTVTVLPEDPTVHELDIVTEDAGERLRRHFHVAILLWSSAFGILALCLTLYWRKKKRLFVYGHPYKGRVTDFVSRSRNATVRYEFEPRPGELLSGKCYFNNWLRPPMVPGDAICVLQDEGNPKDFDLLYRLEVMLTQQAS